MVREIFCKHANFPKEVDDICNQKNLGKLRKALQRNGWDVIPGRGKGGHSQYAKAGLNDKIVLPSGKDSDHFPGYLKKQIRELYACAFPDQFPQDLVERARTRRHGHAAQNRTAAMAMRDHV